MRPLLTVNTLLGGCASLFLLYVGAGELVYDDTVFRPLGVLFAMAGGAGGVATGQWLRVVVSGRLQLRDGLSAMGRAWGWTGFASLLTLASVVVMVVVAVQSA